MVLAYNYSHPCHYNGAGTDTQDISVDDEFSPSDTLLVSIFILTWNTVPHLCKRLPLIFAFLGQLPPFFSNDLRDIRICQTWVLGYCCLLVLAI